MNVGNKPTAILSQNSSEGIQSSPCGTSSILAFWGRAGGVAHGASPGSWGQSWLGCEWREMWCWYSVIRINIHWILMQPIWNSCHLYTPNSQANNWWRIPFDYRSLSHATRFYDVALHANTGGQQPCPGISLARRGGTATPSCLP